MKTDIISSFLCLFFHYIMIWNIEDYYENFSYLELSILLAFFGLFFLGRVLFNIFKGKELWTY